jgi:hypothetical protein
LAGQSAHKTCSGDRELTFSICRFFWRDSKLAELPRQLLPFPAHSREDIDVVEDTNRLVVLPVPYLAPPLSLPIILQQVIPTTLQEIVNVPVGGDASVEMEPDGLLLYLKSASYESGDSCLAAWLPKEGGAVADLAALLSTATAQGQSNSQEVEMEG